MPKKPTPPDQATASRRRAASELSDISTQQEHRPMMAELYRRAEARLAEDSGRKQKAESKKQKVKGQREQASRPDAESGAARAVHELQVHQIELELQNVELLKARNELETSLENYTDLYDFAPVGYCSTDESGLILEANLLSAALLGIERSRLINRRWPAFVSAGSQPDFLEFLKKAFAGARDQICEALLLKEGGGTFWAAFRATTAVSLKGTRKWCRIAFEDITERKAADEALRASEERFRALFELGPVAVYSCDSAGVIQEFNRHAAKLWGREPALGDASEQFCGSFKLFRRDGSFMPHEQCPMAAVVSGKVSAVHDAEVVCERPDGSRICAIVNIRPLKNPRGEITGAINCFYDITERKEAEEALRRNEVLFSALVAQAPVGVYVVDARLRLQQVNPTALPVFKKVRPWLGRELADVLRVLWPRRVADEVVRRFRATLKTGEPYQSPGFGERRRDIGVTEFYEWQIQRVTLPAGEHGVVCFFSNITKRKRAEDAQRRVDVLTASNRKLEREIAQREAVEETLRRSEQHQNRLLEQLRQLSHQILHAQEEERKRISRELHDEIAQTLVGINIHLAGLTREAEGHPVGLQQKIAITQRLVEQSVDVVHRFARELRPTALDDLGLIPTLQSFIKEFTKRTSIPVHFSSFTPGRIKQLNNATRTALYRIAQEALTNVSRHAQASRVDMSLEKLPGALCLKIKDDGKSFQVQRVLNPKRNKRLGLIGMRERLEMVGGTFSIESAPGQGTTVQAQVPVATGRAAN